MEHGGQEQHRIIVSDLGYIILILAIYISKKRREREMKREKVLVNSQEIKRGFLKTFLSDEI